MPRKNPKVAELEQIIRSLHGEIGKMRAVQNLREKLLVTVLSEIREKATVITSSLDFEGHAERFAYKTCFEMLNEVIYHPPDSELPPPEDYPPRD